MKSKKFAVVCLCSITILFIAISTTIFAADVSKMIATGIVIENGDTVPLIKIREVYCFPKPKFKSKREQVRYWEEYYKLVRNVKKVYPYSLLAKRKLEEMDKHYNTLTTPKEKKEYLSKFEKEIFKEFKKPLMGLTFSQGRVLIKLIDKHTGKTTYTILKELKGDFSAVFWQSISVIFQSSLKYEYEPEGRDRMLHEIVVLYEAGLL